MKLDDKEVQVLIEAKKIIDKILNEQINIRTEYVDSIKESMKSMIVSMVQPPVSLAPVKVKKDQGKYAKMIRAVYNRHYTFGLHYMDIVELLYTGSMGLWTKKERHEKRGYGATNLCGQKHWQTRVYAKPGILYQWFDKKNGRWVPKREMQAVVFSKDFKPFKKYIGAI